MRRPQKTPLPKGLRTSPGGRPGRGREAMAFLVHVFHLGRGWFRVLERALTEGWTCCSCETVFCPTFMMLLQDRDAWRNCPSCEGLLWGSFRTRPPSWFKPPAGEEVNHASRNRQAS